MSDFTSRRKKVGLFGIHSRFLKFSLCVHKLRDAFIIKLLIVVSKDLRVLQHLTPWSSNYALYSTDPKLKYWPGDLPSWLIFVRCVRRTAARSDR